MNENEFVSRVAPLFDFDIGTGNVILDLSNIDLLDAGLTLRLPTGVGTGTVDLTFGGGASVLLVCPALSIQPGTIGFFGHPPAAQPAHPVTLGDVIAALTTLGLVHA